MISKIRGTLFIADASVLKPTREEVVVVSCEAILAIPGTALVAIVPLAILVASIMASARLHDARAPWFGWVAASPETAHHPRACCSNSIPLP